MDMSRTLDESAQKVSDFLAARRMFVFYKGAVHLTQPGVDWDHMQMLLNLGVLQSPSDPEFENIVRGYYMGGNLYCYQGRSFTAPRMTDELRSCFVELQRELGLPDSTMVSFGVTKGESGTPWQSPNSSHKLEFIKWPITQATK